MGGVASHRDTTETGRPAYTVQGEFVWGEEEGAGGPAGAGRRVPAGPGRAPVYFLGKYFAMMGLKASGEKPEVGSNLRPLM